LVEREKASMSFATPLLTYQEFRKRQDTHMLRQTEIPVEHAISLPLPTLRWNRPAYISFASPAIRRPNQPMQQGAPDRWWACDASNGKLIIYVLWDALPYAGDVQRDWMTLPTTTYSVAQLQEQLATIELLMTEVASAFFARETGEKAARTALSEALMAYIPQPLLPHYQALAPDFWAWLSQ
jgi:hypothetical protein